MSEIAHDLPKRDPRRHAIAQQIINARSLEDMGAYEVDRDGIMYIEHLQGLQYFLDYVRSLGSKFVLDIGAGTTHGITDMAQAFGKELNFRATVLKNDPKIVDNLGHDKTFITSAELLNGIKNGTVGGIIGIDSVAYSKTPELAIARIDQVLAPGGVLKASFMKNPEEDIFLHSGMGFQTKDLFLSELQQLGYDVGITDSINNREVLLAVKRGNSQAPTAQFLIDEDKKTQADQVRMLMEIKIR